MSRKHKDKFALVKDYIMSGGELSHAAAYSQGIEAGYRLSHKRREDLRAALKEMLGYGRLSQEQAKTFADKVFNGRK